MRWITLLAAVLLVPQHLPGQSRSEGLVILARQYMAAAQWGKADTALSNALDAASYVLDSVDVFVWRGVYQYLQGSDSLARLSFRRALQLRQVTTVTGLDKISPHLTELFEDEARPFRIYRASDLDAPATWRSGPALAYPPELRSRRIAGDALVRAVVDTLGRVEAGSIVVLDSPDSAFNAPLERMLSAAQFTPGRVKGHVVRSQVDLGFSLHPPAPANPTSLIGAARDQLRLRRADSALALTGAALDSANQPSAAERMYALLVRGLAWHAKGRDSLAAAAWDDGLAGYRDLTARGVDLAPFLKRLADSIRLGRRSTAPGHAAPFGTPTTVETVDEQPVLIAYPPIRYAPEMQALRIGGTVIVQATLDTSGHVLPATVTVVHSPNSVFDAEARRLVLGAKYRPARVRGHPTRATIRQPVTFAAY